MNQEMIGATIKIIGALNPSLVGKEGKVLNETKNTLTIRRGKKQETILKKGVILRIIKDNRFEEKIIEGKKIAKRSYERM